MSEAGGGGIRITLNGEPHELAGEQTIADFLQALGLEPVRVAVEVNESLVRRGEFAAHRLRGGDRVEIVTLVGGG